MKMLSLRTHMARVHNVEIKETGNSCSLLNEDHSTVSSWNNAVREMEMPFYEIENEKVIPGYAHKPWDRKQFYSDYPIFTDADLEMMSSDNFGQMSTDLLRQKETALLKTRIYFTKLLERTPEAITYIMEMYPNVLKWAKAVVREESDKRYDWLMAKKLAGAQAPTHSQDLGQAGSIAAKFHEGEHDEHQTASYGQLNRMIWEDCKIASGEIKIPQLTKPGACSIPSHLRIEQMQKYMNLSLNQATVLAKIYRILDLGYAQVAVKKIGKGSNRMTLNNHIRKFVKQGNGQPWDIMVAPGKSLLELAKEIKALALEEQEDPEWAKADHFIPGNIGATYTKEEFGDYLAEYISPEEEYISPEEDSWDRHRGDPIPKPQDLDEKSNVWLSMNGEHYSIIRDDEDRERQFDQANPVGMYTYNNLSMIPKADHLQGGNVKLFSKLIDKLTALKLTDKARIAGSQWVKKHGTFAQKSFWQKSLNQMVA